ncbi:MAG: hypothetical protein JW741_28185 [Sedimentisphaerales bacterium]|nr:hypothetical protein [Sedimentisphaerales bacterium]
MNEKQASTLCWAIKALLAGILVYVAVETATKPLHLRKALKPHAAAGDERGPQIPGTSSEPHRPADLSNILKNNLFTSTDAAPAPTDPGPRVLPVARVSAEPELGLRLVGTIAGGPITSRAVIEDTATKTTRPYKIGDVVASAVVESVRADAVVLSYKGRKITLSRHTGTISTDNGGSQPNHAQDATRTRRDPSGERTMQPPSAKLGYVEDIFRKATVEPHVENGQTQGLKITGLENTPLAGMFGLRNGDVVRAVNGQNLTSKQKAFQVLQKARTQPQIRIELLRKDQVKELAFDL